MMTWRRTLLLSSSALLLVPAAALAQTETVRLLGEVRVRGEAERPAVTDTADAFTLLRSRLGIEATLSPRAVVLLQVQDARAFGEGGGTMDGSAERLDMHQAWLQYRVEAGMYRAVFRVGRQEIALGNERLVGAVGWSNTGRAFDGARVAAGTATGDWRLHGFAATVQERGRRISGAQQDRGDHLFVGGYLESTPLDVFLLHDREDAYRSFTGVDRSTLGARLASPVLGVLMPSVEGAYQIGNQVWAGGVQPMSQDIRAYMVGARLGYLTPLPILNRAGVGLDLLSGDADPADDTYRAFNTLYATNHRFYGYIDLFLEPAARTRDRGLIDGIASARLALTRDLALDIDGHGFWLHREFAGSSDRHLGWELDLTLPVQLGANQQLQLGYSAFRNGPAAPLIGLGRERAVWHWAHVQATFSFGGRAAPIL
ncbi:alginate export family protein [soil metagenome]